MAGVLQVPSCRLAAGVLGVLAIAACRQDAPPEVRAQIPADASAAASVDIAQVLEWAPVARDRSRLLGVVADAMLEAADACDVGLAEGRVTAAWDDDRVTIVVAASGVGRTSALRCLASGIKDQGVSIDADAEPIILTAGRTSIEARSGDDDTLVLHVPRTEGAAAVDPDDLGLDEDSPLADAMARVDHRHALWAVASDSTDTPWAGIFGGGSDVALGVDLDDDAADIVLAGAREDDEPDAVRDGIAGALAAVYLPTSIAERVDVQTEDGKLAVSFEIASTEAYALDVRWLGDVPGDAPEPVGDAMSPEALALLQSWSTPSPEAVTAVAVADEGLVAGKYPRIGIPACDEYVELYSKCIEDKLPVSATETASKALQTTVEAWKQAAATPAGEEALGQACKAAAEAVRSSCA